MKWQGQREQPFLFARSWIVGIYPAVTRLNPPMTRVSTASMPFVTSSSMV